MTLYKKQPMTWRTSFRKSHKKCEGNDVKTGITSNPMGIQYT